MGTYIVGTLVFGLIVFICVRLYKNKQSGNSCGSCGGCSNSAHCKGHENS
ncbi:MAG TPA: FeoB-associated Cys-rich membrane protein [Ruminiclostridium sp.]|nr:FeoB-associated Cys-rich membrane protein [Ruminiclostridium sp.]